MPRASPVPSAETGNTRGRILATAQKLVQAQGFNATTVDAICRGAGVTKGSFFHYFPSKDDLGAQLLDEFWAAVQRAQEQAPYQRETQPAARLGSYFDFVARLYTDPWFGEGCLLAVFTQELADPKSPIRRLCSRRFAQWSADLEREFGAALPERSKSELRSLAAHFITVLEGALILAKARRDPRVVASGVRHFQSYLRSLGGADS